MVYFLCKASDSGRQNCYFALSLPVRGAWVEIYYTHENHVFGGCRSPCGERGLKYKAMAQMEGKTVAPRAGSVG